MSALYSLVRKYSPEILFLSETKSNKTEIRRAQDKLRFDHSVCVEATGRAGGLALFWMNEASVNINLMNEHIIDFHVRNDNMSSWRMSGVYGWSESSQKFRTWDLINQVGTNNDQPWVLGGDFNEILLDSDKRGGTIGDFNSMSAFRDCLDANGLRDMDTTGNHFTWSNKRTEGYIEEKLDRCVCNEAWNSMFPSAIVENITWDGSDHDPIMLWLRGDAEDSRRDRLEDLRPFRFEARWLHHNGFDENLRAVWNSARESHGIDWCRMVEAVGSGSNDGTKTFI